MSHLSARQLRLIDETHRIARCQGRRTDLDPFAGLIQDLGRLDSVWIETNTPDISLRQQAHWRGARLDGASARVSGRRFRLEARLAAWHALRGEPETPALLHQARIEDAQGQAVLRLRVEGTADAARLERLLRTHAPLVRLPRAARDAAAVSGIASVSRDAESLGAEDLAELHQQQRLDPTALRQRGQLDWVDATLVPCLLEAAANQMLSLRLAAGTPGLVQQLERTVYSFRWEGGGWARLSGEQATLRLDTEAIDSAWVLRRPDGRQQLRLYDEEGRALLFIDSPPGLAEPEHPIWRTLINALRD